MHLDFVIPGKPVPWDKARARNGHIYKPPRLRAWQEKVRAAVFVAVNNKDASGPFPVPKDMPVVLEITVFAKRPKGLPMSVHYDTRKPDATNIQKGIEDALTKLVYPDDAQVVSPVTHKRFVQPGGEPHVRIRVWEAGHRPGMRG